MCMKFYGSTQMALVIALVATLPALPTLINSIMWLSTVCFHLTFLEDEHFSTLPPKLCKTFKNQGITKQQKWVVIVVFLQYSVWGALQRILLGSQHPLEPSIATGKAVTAAVSPGSDATLGIVSLPLPHSCTHLQLCKLSLNRGWMRESPPAVILNLLP